MQELEIRDAQIKEFKRVLKVFFKTVEVGGKQYKPNIKRCAGCPHITMARGWECFFDRYSTTCRYPDKFMATLKKREKTCKEQ